METKDTPTKSEATAARIVAAAKALFVARNYADVTTDMLAQAARTSTMANIVDNRQGLKIDLSFVGDDGYLRGVIGRRVRNPIGASQPEFWFVTAEDVILMKLLWRKDSQSTKQWNDALGVVRVRGARLDWKYLHEQAGVIDVADQLTQLRDDGGV